VHLEGVWAHPGRGVPHTFPFKPPDGILIFGPAQPVTRGAREAAGRRTGRRPRAAAPQAGRARRRGLRVPDPPRLRSGRSTFDLRRRRGHDRHLLHQSAGVGVAVLSKLSNTAGEPNPAAVETHQQTLSKLGNKARPSRYTDIHLAFGARLRLDRQIRDPTYDVQFDDPLRWFMKDSVVGINRSKNNPLDRHVSDPTSAPRFGTRSGRG
jgi:hypothetical protein